MRRNFADPLPTIALAQMKSGDLANGDGPPPLPSDMVLSGPRKTIPTPVAWYLAALSLIFAYAVLQSGGTVAVHWDRCMVGLGLLVLVYFGSGTDAAPPLQSWLRWPLLALLGFIGLQLVPLPLWLLKIISPARADLFESLSPISRDLGSAAAISVFPPATLAHLLRAMSYMVTFIMARELAWKSAANRWLVVLPVVTVAGAEAICGLLQYNPSIPDAGVSGSYLNRNHFAGLLELSLPFAVIYPIAILRTGRGLFREALFASLSVAFAVLIVLGILLSLSRMAFAASLSSLIVIGCVTLGMGMSWRRRVAAVALLGSSVITAFLYLAPDTLVARFGEVIKTEEGSTQLRIELWTDTLVLASNYPLVGTGLGTFEQVFQKYKTFGPQLAVDSAHNDYLQAFAELGLIGFTIASIATAALFLVAFRTAWGTANSASWYLAVACLCSFLAILMHSFTDLNLYIPANAMLLAWIAGIAASLNVEGAA